MKTIKHENGMTEKITVNGQGKNYHEFFDRDGRKFEAYLDLTSNMDLSEKKRTLLDHVMQSMMD
jgi:hypothetical protein